MTISQLIISYYDTNKNIIWVDHQFIKEGVRQQKKQSFSYPILTTDEIKKLLSSTKNCIINGIENGEVGEKFIPARVLEHHHKDLQPIENGFIKIEITAKGLSISNTGNPPKVSIPSLFKRFKRVYICTPIMAR